MPVIDRNLHRGTARISLAAWSWAVLAVVLSALMLPAAPARATTPTYTTNYVWDTNRRLVTMVIEPDTGTGVRVATRFIYDVDGEVTEVDKGTTTQSNGSDFAPVEEAKYAYDLYGNQIQTQVLNGTATPPLALSQTTYDADNRKSCSAARMNPAVYAALLATAVSGSSVASSLPTGACTLGTAGSNGNDRITQLNYDAASEKITVVRALGTAKQITYETDTYTLDSKLASVEDANANKTAYVYDGFDRLHEADYPVTTPGQNSASSASGLADCATAAPAGSNLERYCYDNNGNRTALYKRDGSVITYVYDNLNREVAKHWPTGGGALDVYSGYNSSTGQVGYDLMGRKIYAHYGSEGGTGVSYSYDVAGRLHTETTGSQILTYGYDLASNRTQVTWPDGFYAGYLYDADDHLTTVNENGATSGVGLLATYSYNSANGLQLLSGISNGDGSSSAYTYDNADRLSSLAHTMPSGGAAANQTLAFTYNPTSQILTRAGSNYTYDYAGYTAGTINKAYDGLNRDATIAAIGTQPCAVSGSGYDCNGSLNNDGNRTFAYDSENRLVSASISATSTSATLSYDPLGRLQTYTVTVGSGSPSATNFLYSGDQLVAEYNASGVMLRRYVHAAGEDLPLVWYEGAVGSTDRRWLHADNQGSIIAWSNAAGAVTTTSYDPYGAPQSWSGSRFSYTGQIMLAELSLYHYKARAYDPTTGRFLQVDPVGYTADNDLYAYVGADPTNASDSSGTDPENSAPTPPPSQIQEEPHWQAACATSGCTGRPASWPPATGTISTGHGVGRPATPAEQAAAQKAGAQIMTTVALVGLQFIPVADGLADALLGAKAADTVVASSEAGAVVDEAAAGGPAAARAASRVKYEGPPKITGARVGAREPLRPPNDWGARSTMPGRPGGMPPSNPSTGAQKVLNFLIQSTSLFVRIFGPPLG